MKWKLSRKNCIVMKCIYSKKRHRVFVLFRFVTHHHTYDARELIKSNRTSKRKQQTSMMKKGAPCVNASINFTAMPIAITIATVIISLSARNENWAFILRHQTKDTQHTDQSIFSLLFEIVVNLSVDGIEWIQIMEMEKNEMKKLKLEISPPKIEINSICLRVQWSDRSIWMFSSIIYYYSSGLLGVKIKDFDLNHKWYICK